MYTDYGRKGTNIGCNEKGGNKNEGKIQDSNSQNFGFHTILTHLVFSIQYVYLLDRCPPFKNIVSVMVCSNNTRQYKIDNLQYFYPLCTHCLHQTYAGPQVSYLNQGHSSDQGNYPQEN